MRAELLKCPIFRQSTTKVLRTDKQSFQGVEELYALMVVLKILLDFRRIMSKSYGLSEKSVAFGVPPTYS